MHFRHIVVLLLIAFSSLKSLAQTLQKDTIPKTPEKKWFEKISMRGYTQVRYNRLMETNPDLKCDQCDKSWGENGGIFFRRIRIAFYGQVHERVYIYIQPDFATSPSSGNLNFAQIRDAYFDLSLDKKREFRLRFGQSKVPFGFENLQSSSNRLPLDRDDAINSALPNERDLGLFFYWAPQKIRERFSAIGNSILKGSGDYGVFGFGVFNGQTANKPDENNSLHTVARVSYPFQLKNGQIIEAGLQAYTGKIVVTSVTKDVVGINSKMEYNDRRVAGSLILYPQPLGIMAEYNVGTGPEYNPSTNKIDQKRLFGGYVLLNYHLKFGKQSLYPFYRYQYYSGGKKQELDARRYRVLEHEFGLEWQPIKAFELVAEYVSSNRAFEDAVLRQNYQQGRLLRLQVQFNY
jgi:phosphate-selective porin